MKHTNKMKMNTKILRQLKSQNSYYCKRAVTIVWTAITGVVMIGFVALAVDVGYTYHVKTQLQRTADAAAMAAASQLADEDQSHQAVYDLAAVYAAMNKTGGISPELTDADVVLGRAVLEDDGKYTFAEGEEPPDAVKVTVRLTDNSPNGPLGLFFGQALGKGTVNLSASAVAILVPRDIAIVIDLSNSMSYDSQLKHEDSTDINIEEVWEDLGSPTFGNMTVFHNSYSEMPYYRYQSRSEIKTLLGLDGVPYPYPGGSWDDYIKYVKYYLDDSWRPYCERRYAHRYGLRTWVHYLLDRRPAQSETPALADTHEQPTYAVKQAVEELCNFLLLLDSNDHLALCSFTGRAYDGGSDARTHQQLTDQYMLITQAAYERQAGEYGRYTNIYAGIEEGISELTSSRARSSAKKVIFILTDGNPNQPGGSYSTGADYARQAAEHAISLGIQIYTITLGSSANQSLMEEIAEIGKGIHYHVPTLDVEQYEDDLKDVFRTLGGKRPVRLIE